MLLGKPMMSSLLYVLCLCSYIALVFFSVTTQGAINDPTRPIYSENANSSVSTSRLIKEQKILLLQSIFFTETHKTAVVNNEIYKEGDVVNEMIVESIKKDYVLVRYKKQSLKLLLAKKLYIDKATGEISE